MQQTWLLVALSLLEWKQDFIFFNPLPPPVCADIIAVYDQPRKTTFLFFFLSKLYVSECSCLGKKS